MFQNHFFRDLKPFVGSKEFVENLLKLELDVWICTQPVSDLAESYTDKVKAIKMHFPQLKDKIILTQNKAMVKADVLIDDHPEKFMDGSEEWKVIKFHYKNDSIQEYARVLEEVKYILKCKEVFEGEEFNRDETISEAYGEKL